MLIAIIKNTPSWVFILFTILLWVGFKQSKTRTVKITVSLILPIAMLILSLHTILTIFSDVFISLSLWIATICVACYIGLIYPSHFKVQILAPENYH